MKILVTGGAGFIGSHLVDRLLRDGNEVIVIDNSPENFERNLSHHRENPKFTFSVSDIRNIDKLKDQYPLNTIGCDWKFVHLAALADIVPSIDEPLDYHDTNVNGTVQLLELARERNIEKFIYAASSSCYGDKPNVPTKETDPINCKYPYALTKWMGEQYVQHWNKVYGLPTISLRLFNVYGPRSRTTGAYGAVFGVFLSQKIHNKPYTVVGSGSQSRDFIYVTDVVQAIILAMSSKKSGEIYNIGSGGHTSINNLVNLLGVTSGVEKVPARPGEPDITMAWIGKAQTELGFNPAMSLPKGVKIMLDNIKYWENAPVWDRHSIGRATESWFNQLGDRNDNQLR